MPLEVGAVVEGKVTGITHYGAFIELSPGVTGLVHISEVADAYVKDIKEFLKENDQVKVKIINMDKGKIGLSIRQANPSSTPQRQRTPSPRAFEDRLARYLKDSDERLTDLRRSQDSKRGGRGTRRDY
jgi:S1 RNA binding domain protein